MLNPSDLFSSTMPISMPYPPLTCTRKVICIVMWLLMSLFQLLNFSLLKMPMFWKKIPIGIEFAKHFGSHLSPIEGLVLTVDGLLCCTVLDNHSIKIYVVVNFDMMVMIHFCMPLLLLKGFTSKEMLKLACH
ncbi:hypothetical protein VNO77_04291 [Canavalia gladiata]|uniref:Uncharacterized protein n=1 Tax=Canavalia gladiata TaxID=3824 RepID=A0AAN9MWX7_CANGL